MGASESKPEIIMLLVGKTGDGKSSAGNTILRKQIFSSKSSPISITENSAIGVGMVCDRKIKIIDLPGFFDTRDNEDIIKEKLTRALVECAPGPPILTIVLKVGKYTLQEREVETKIWECLEESKSKHPVVLFTHGEDLEGQTIKEFVNKSLELQKFVDKCGGRCHVIDNKYWKNSWWGYRSNRVQVRNLLETIDKMEKENTSELFQILEEQITERMILIDPDLSQQERRERAKKTVYETLLIKFAGVATGTLVGAVMGIAVPVASLVAIVKGVKNMSGTATDAKTEKAADVLTTGETKEEALAEELEIRVTAALDEVATGGSKATTGATTTAKIGTTAATVGATTANIGATAATGGATAAKIGATAATVGATAATVGATAATVGATAATVGATTAKIGATAATGGATAAKIGATAATVGATTAKIGATAATAGATAVSAGTVGAATVGATATAGAVGAGAAATVGATAGATVGATAGAVGAVTGATAGAVGATVGATAGTVGAATVGATAGAVGTTAGAVGAAAGATVGAAAGATAGTVGAAAGATAGTVGAAAGATVGAATAATVGAAAGATAGTVGAAAGATVGAATAATVGATAGTVGAAAGATVGTTAGATAGAVAGVGIGAAAGTGIAAGVILGTAALAGAIRGGITGYTATEEAESVLDAIKIAAKANQEKAKKVVGKAGQFPSNINKFL